MMRDPGTARRAGAMPSDHLSRFARVTIANFFFFLSFASFFLLPLHVRALGGSERLVRRGGFDVLFLSAAAFSAIGFVVAWPLAHRRSVEAATAARFRISADIGVAVVTIACCGVAFGGVITYVPTFIHDADLGP